MRRICVFCGANPGARPAYADATEELARVLVGEGIGLVYGGASVGLMGTLADTVLAEGGEAIGVMPQSLIDKEIGHNGLSDLRVVGSMHERKALMADLSDAFIALPGGLGTLEELFEVYTWSQLGLHQKPCGLLDVHGYYAGIASFLTHAVEERFLREEHREMLMVEREPRALVERLREWRPGTVQPKWSLGSGPSPPLARTKGSLRGGPSPPLARTKGSLRGGPSPPLAPGRIDREET